jgi:DNA-binding NarL/FixJ family response regulator
MPALAPSVPSVLLPGAVLVVDDHDLVRLGLRTLLQSYAGAAGSTLEVIEARTLQAALAALRARGETIAVVLLDLHLPDAHDCVDVRTAEGRCVQLTRRQSQVLERVLAGQSNRQIAEQTHLTEGTIKNHVSALLLMFGVRSRSQLISLLR